MKKLLFLFLFLIICSSFAYSISVVGFDTIRTDNFNYNESTVLHDWTYFEYNPCFSPNPYIDVFGEYGFGGLPCVGTLYNKYLSLIHI